MTIDFQTFRRSLLRELTAAKTAQADLLLHLIYTPELHDPLGLVGDSNREMALIHPTSHIRLSNFDPETAPRLLTLDCRRVASYLLETDPGLDDPAFEHSITQAHAEICLGQSQDPGLSNDELDVSEFAIGGWVITDQSAKALAYRLRRASLHQGLWVRWSNPTILDLLWPSMTDTQRFALLGTATWFCFGWRGQLRRYAAAKSEDPFEPQAPMPPFNDHQRGLLKNMPLMRDLMGAWTAMCAEQGQRLPVNADEKLYEHLKSAQLAGFDPESVAIYAVTAVQLRHGATSDREWASLVRHTAENGLALRDLLGTLSDEFWKRYSLRDHENQ